ncbi:MAG: hypothetical protein CMQ29_13080 [Gammaproteobacteria bacterium]|nr:hypothetical protein [Gammaproteobacteria bacterium]|tara:strand:+ start:1324 stop:2028 length:705 start_codon:yes stop_codon:yes gene_type:complete
MTTSQTNSDLDAGAVEAWLRQHPEFFRSRSELLGALELSHVSGTGTVSLIERQVAVLREKDASHQEQLETLLRFAEANHAIYLRTQSLVLSVMEADDAGELFYNLERSFADDFGCNSYGLIVFHKVPRQINHYTSCVTLTTAKAYVGAFLAQRSAVLGLPRPEEQDFLFQHADGKVGSAAVLPIFKGDDPIAVLALGTREPSSFDPNAGTVFIDFVAAVLAHTLPRYLHLGDPG